MSIIEAIYGLYSRYRYAVRESYAEVKIRRQLRAYVAIGWERPRTDWPDDLPY